MSRLIKKTVTGEGTRLMKITGTGEVFLGDQLRTSTRSTSRTTRSP